MKWFRSGLFRKFAIVMGVLALVPMTYLAFYLSQIGQRGIQSAVLELHTKLAEKLAEKVDVYFETSEDKLKLCLLSLRKDMAWSDKQELLKALVETQPNVVEFSIVNRQGQELMKVFNPDLSSDGVLASRAEEAAFKGYLEGRGRVMEIGAGGAAVLYYAVSDRLAARAALFLGNLSEAVAGERVGGTGFAVLVDSQGQPLFYSSEKLPEALRRGFSEWSIVKTALKSQTIGASDLPFRGPDGHELIGAYAPVRAIQGAVVILQSRDEAYFAALQMRRASRIALILVALAAVFGATFMARRLTSPLLELTRGAEAVAHGSFEVDVKVKTKDELQELAETFNRMTAQLRTYSEIQVDRLVAEQRKTGAVLFSINDGIAMTDPEGRVQLFNRKAFELLDIGSGEALEGKPLTEVLAKSKMRDAIMQSWANPKPDVFKDVDLSTDKVLKYIRVTSTPVVSPSTGAVIGVVTALRDVTLERELDKMKEEFLHYITHDLRNPLGSAMGFIDVLLKGLVGVLNPEQQSIVSSIQRSTSRLMAMINNILDIAKMESGRIRLQLKAVSLSGVAGRAISILESLARQKNVTVKLDVAEEFTIEVDSDLMERVFTNLIGNAIKYTPQDGVVTVSIADDGAVLKCCVADTGEGVPEAYRERIFEKFEQVAGQRKGGTGLGLTITKFFVESHLGRIWVESEIGKGSRFYFTIPKTLVVNDNGEVTAAERVA